MNTEIKKLADSGDIKSLKYIFVDSLDVDPTFARYEEEYNYCKSIPGLLEPHVELTPFRENKADWNEEYWTSLKMDLIKNFSDQRMSHMRRVAKVFLADKAQRIQEERAARNVIRQSSAPESHESHIVVKKLSISQEELQKRAIEEEKRRNAAEYQAALEREAREKAAASEQRNNSYKPTYPQRGESSKKVIGIAAAAVAAAVILFLLLK